MSQRLVFIGDCHWRTDTAFYNGNIKLFDYLVKTYSQDVVFFSGDLFDKSNPHFDHLVDVVGKYLDVFPEVHILTGNHDSSKKAGNALKSFSRMQNVTVYHTQETYINIHGYQVLMLPFVRNLAKSNYRNLKQDVDICFSHLSPVGKNFGSDEIDFNFKATIGFFYGHIHKPESFELPNGKHEIIGVPQATRLGEQGWPRECIIVEDGKYYREALPSFMEIELVRFGDTPKSNDNLIVVTEAPSVQDVLQKYEGYHIHTEAITFKSSLESSTEAEFRSISWNSSLSQHFDDYTNTEEGQTIDDEVKSFIRQRLAQHSV